LIYSLPVALLESANYFSLDEQDAYRTAFEADIINLLVGPLAEAKYVAVRDHECFNKNLITPKQSGFAIRANALKITRKQHVSAKVTIPSGHAAFLGKT
jgi:hypothetical protein